jgi:endonuclease YncB( thermonuclease family)
VIFMLANSRPSFYHYRVKECSTIDGDTVIAVIALGFDVTYKSTFRLAGIDAPEKRPLKTRAAAVATQKRLQELIDAALEQECLSIRTEKGDPKEKYGRYLAWLSKDGEQTTFNDMLVEEGLAVLYDGGTRG